MNRDDLVKAMAEAIWRPKVHISGLNSTDDANHALTALEVAIPGLSGVIEGTHALLPAPFPLGERVTKKSGSSWTGPVCGYYSTSLNPEGVCVESETETGSVQLYPAKAMLAAHKHEPDPPQADARAG